MSRWLFCGGLFVEALSSLLAIPGVSEVGIISTGAVGALLAVLGAAYKLVGGPFGIVLGPPAETYSSCGVR